MRENAKERAERLAREQRAREAQKRVDRTVARLNREMRLRAARQDRTGTW